jgi:hypothetical protein
MDFDKWLHTWNLAVDYLSFTLSHGATAGYWWLVVSGLILWPLAWWSGRRRRHPTVLVSAILMTLICLALLTPWLMKLVMTGAQPAFLTLLALTPITSCVAIAQVAMRLGSAPVHACWISWGISALMAFVLPFMFLAAACIFANSCV